MEQASRAQGFYSPIESKSPDEVREEKLQKVLRLIDAAYAQSGEFKTRMDEARIKPADIGSFEDFSRIPALRKKDLIRLQSEPGRLGGLLACDFGKLRRIYQSPGPIFDPEGRSRDYWGWAEAFHAAGFRRGDLVQMTFSYHLTPAGLMLEEPLMELGCAVIPAGPGNTDVQIDLMTRLPVTGFVGMTSYLDVIATKAADAGYKLKEDFKLEVAFVAAERLPESLRQKVQDAFGMIIRQGYGTADVGCIAYECLELSGMHASSRGLVEICEPGSGVPLPAGEMGEVVFTPFTDAYPLIRFATGDLSIMDESPCACGRTSSRLKGILGRVDDTAKVKGQFIYPSQAAEVVCMFPCVKGWQLVVDNPGGKDSLEIRTCCEGNLDVDKFMVKFQDKLKLRPKVTVLPDGEEIPGDAPKLLDKRRFD
jgi:phenylacetate-CoA ligase